MFGKVDDGLWDVGFAFCVIVVGGVVDDYVIEYGSRSVYWYSFWFSSGEILGVYTPEEGVGPRAGGSSHGFVGLGGRGGWALIGALENASRGRENPISHWGMRYRYLPSTSVVGPFRWVKDLEILLDG